MVAVNRLTIPTVAVDNMNVFLIVAEGETDE